MFWRSNITISSPYASTSGLNPWQSRWQRQNIYPDRSRSFGKVAIEGCER
jgi:hypothetical protein